MRSLAAQRQLPAETSGRTTRQREIVLGNVLRKYYGAHVGRLHVQSHLTVVGSALPRVTLQPFIVTKKKLDD